MEQFFYKVFIAVFRNREDINHLWYGPVSLLATSIEDAREKALLQSEMAPDIQKCLSDVINPHYRVYSIVRSRQVF